MLSGKGITNNDQISSECLKIWTGLSGLFHVLFVFVTDTVVRTAGSADDVVVDANSLDMFASPITSVMRRATSNDDQASKRAKIL